MPYVILFIAVNIVMPNIDKQIIVCVCGVEGGNKAFDDQ